MAFLPKSIKQDDLLGSACPYHVSSYPVKAAIEEDGPMELPE